MQGEKWEWIGVCIHDNCYSLQGRDHTADIFPQFLFWQAGGAFTSAFSKHPTFHLHLKRTLILDKVSHKIDRKGNSILLNSPKSTKHFPMLFLWRKVTLTWVTTYCMSFVMLLLTKPLPFSWRRCLRMILPEGCVSNSLSVIVSVIVSHCYWISPGAWHTHSGLVAYEVLHSFFAFGWIESIFINHM